tara:strand:+ start:807 stop:1751 length:945 start_codon:yes stop_codon:yes gene_type:complete
MLTIDAIIVGAGSWGKALAHTLSINKKKVLIYSRNTKQNDQNILQTNNIDDLLSNQLPLIIATPVNSLREIGCSIKKNNYEGPIILACKGIESESGLFPSQIISDFTLNNKIAILSGPSFASEVIKNKPTAVSIAATDNDILKIFTEMFHSKFFRVYASNDLIGCQLGGAMKNILSVAVGISDGLDLGANAKAALITRGILEIKNLGKILGCDVQTIYGLSGLGDLVLTANDDLSRNRSFGLEIAKGASVKEAEKKIGHIVEGIYASKGLNILIKKHSLNLPICSKVIDIVNEKISPKEAVNDLLIREQKKEFV